MAIIHRMVIDIKQDYTGAFYQIVKITDDRGDQFFVEEYLDVVDSTEKQIGQNVESVLITARIVRLEHYWRITPAYAIPQSCGRAECIACAKPVIGRRIS